MRNSLYNRFEPTRILKQDRFGLTFIGIDHVLDLPNVLIKIIRKEHFQKDTHELTDFFSWHRGVSHPHLARILDAGLTPKNELFCVRDCFQDSKKPPTVDQSNVAEQLIAAIALMHRCGRLHLNIRPSNVLFVGDQLKLVDARPPGVALKDDEESIRFNAPEILAGGNASFASDIYSIGAVLYRLCAGKDPFDDIDLHNLKSKYRWAAIKPLSTLCYIPDAVSDLVMRSLERDATKRPSIPDYRQVFSRNIFASTSPFVGRQQEIRFIQAWIANRTGAGLRLLFVDGAPGNGKSRLVEEVTFVTAFQAGDCVVGHCKTEREQPLSSFVAPLKTLLAKRAALSGQNVAQILGNFCTTVSGLLNEANRFLHSGIQLHRLISDLASLLHSLSNERSITLVLDDIEYADSFTIRLLEELCLRSSGVRINLILTRTPSPRASLLGNTLRELVHGNAEFLVLELLERQAANELLSHIGVNERELDRMYEISGGNPLLMEEIPKSDVQTSKYTARIEKKVSAIFDGLSPQGRHVLNVLSVFSKQMSVRLLQVATAEREHVLSKAISELAHMELIVLENATARLQHEILRSIIYSRISNSRKIALHKLAFELLKNESDTNTLAHHAFRGRLFKEASDLCQKAAADLSMRGRYREALQLYQQTRISLKTLGKDLDSVAEADRALCFLRVGKNGLAERIYRNLLAKGPVSSASDLLPAIYATLASPESRNPISEQARLCSLAIETSHPNSPKLCLLYAHLSQLLVQLGDMKNAAKTLQCAEETLSESHDEYRILVHAAKAYLLLHSGRFREALNILEKMRPTNEMRTGAVLTNTALCWEYLGDVTRAREVQTKAQKAAEMSGYAFIRLLSFINLGVFALKVGDLREAADKFDSAKSLLSELNTRDAGFRPAMASVLYLDLAQLQIEQGLYRDALENLRKASKSGIHGLEGASLFFTRCRLNLIYGDTLSTKRLLTQFGDADFFQNDYCRVERTLIASYINELRRDDLISLLTEALDVSANLGTSYQGCLVLLQFSETLLGLNNREESRKRAAEALIVAEKHSYRILETKALLMIALASETTEEALSRLLTTLHQAIEIGLPETVAKVCFYVSRQQHAIGNYISAEHYLTRSTSLINELVQNVPAKFRRKYLAEPWRLEARTLLVACRNRLSQSISLSRGPIETVREDQHFRSLYRVAVCAGSVKNLGTFLTTVLQSLEISIDRPLVVMIQSKLDVTFRFSRCRHDAELESQIQFFAKNCDRVYFGDSEKTKKSESVAWIPFRGDVYLGGIYIGDRGGHAAFSEKEMEFLTILGLIGTAALRQIERIEASHETNQSSDFHGLIGASKAIREVYSQIQIAAGNAATVLVEGESGTGKELVAKAIHAAGARAKEAFVAVDCGALPEGLIEAELFGAKKGSYTGAVADRPGLFESAHRGTLFLDEISNTTPALQAKLLRVIQEREVRRIGETKGRPIDVRLIVASNQSLEALAEDGRLRKDLFYRLKVLHIKVPPLRNRRDDIPILAQAFLQKLNAANKTKKHFAPGIMDHLSAQTFAGNVRELQNVVERAFFFAKGAVIADVPLESDGQAVSSADEVQSWFKDLSEGRKDFWSAIHNKYKRRDISREKIVALVDYGLRSTRGSYKNMASTFRLKGRDYRRFMDFLRRNDCLLDFRPYRKSADADREN